ncbi:MAG: RdgB/HAM1 family non-canonical purine NTP pyrophosphatase [Candidatus Izemoplasmatales bacterium]|jgi:XTP/dITP diphosphohydrolase|nr:RdgB/HAM1 family non-canonical purine NTP pyrophosphatase [Candidatus Izemoplasmatales bacterium]
MKKIYIASTNPGKIKEYKEALKDVLIESIIDLRFDLTIEETGNTFKENSFIKAQKLYEKVKSPVLADDSGLIVNALIGELGVKSKRFSKSETDADNMNLLLEKLKNEKDRSAYFETVICLYLNPKEIYYFSGKTKGKILIEKRGISGFGYDPLFLPEGKNKTYAEMNIYEKQAISHRGKAIKKLIEAINNETVNL